MRFFKYHGTGNDFVVLDRLSGGPLPSPEEVEAWCRRHTGIGADGVICACPPVAGGDARMCIFNADGSEAEMCGNGIRCLARFLYEHAGIKKNEMLIETAAGSKSLSLSVEAGEVREVEVDMGAPELAAPDLPASDDPANRPGVVSISGIPEGPVDAFCVSMGNPHCVIVVDDVSQAPVSTLGPAIERHRLFPRRVNVEFVEVTGEGRLKVRVWERGVGETQACGTGACAAAVAAVNLDRCSFPVHVALPGGTLVISVDQHGHVLMRGPAVEVFRGELTSRRGKER
ncbi:MAG: diaminopimelate epimerase [Actinobacteria bacterium]|nr:diaminopimelate epimerase [Actinomycetota bacterium]